MDRIYLVPDRVRLSDETVASCQKIIHNFDVEWRGKPLKAATFVSTAARVTLLASLQDDGSWLVTLIDANLPSLLSGHNGRPLRTNEVLALALTRLKFLIAKVVKADDRERIIPGVGPDNNGYIQKVEAMIQLQDQNHLLLTASHVARYPGQHRAALVGWGESSRTRSGELSLSFYDKQRELKGSVTPEGCGATRVECTIKRTRLVKELKALDSRLSGQGAAKTLSLQNSYDILRRNVRLISGFGSSPDTLQLSLSRTARTLISGLGTLAEPHHVDQAMTNYKLACNPCKRTFRQINKEVRSYAFAALAPDIESLFPPNREDIAWANVSLAGLEWIYDLEMKSLGAPLAGDPAILAAWSQTTLLSKQPDFHDPAGTLFTSSASLPWKVTR